MKRSTVELCIQVLEASGGQELGKPENREQVEKVFAALDDLYSERDATG